MLRTEPFWRSQFPRPDDLPVSATLPERVDVAIVGSGYTGLNAARMPAKSGAPVSILERETKCPRRDLNPHGPKPTRS